MFHMGEGGLGGISVRKSPIYYGNANLEIPTVE